MKKIDLIILLTVSTGLIATSITLYLFTTHFSAMSNVERAQQAYEKAIANPKSLSAEESTMLIGIMVKSEQARKKVWDSLFKAAKSLGLILLALSMVIIATTISIYKRGCIKPKIPQKDF